MILSRNWFPGGEVDVRSLEGNDGSPRTGADRVADQQEHDLGVNSQRAHMFFTITPADPVIVRDRLIPPIPVLLRKRGHRDTEEKEIRGYFFFFFVSRSSREQEALICPLSINGVCSPQFQASFQIIRYINLIPINVHS